MRRISIGNVVIENTQFDKLNVLTDDDDKVIFLPLLWTIHLANTGSVYRWHKRGSFTSTGSIFQTRKQSFVEKVFEMRSVAENTIDNYIGHLFQFIKYINTLNKTAGTPSVHHTELINSRFINHYLNSILPEKLRSVASLNAHQAAISAYFSFLYEIEIKDLIPSTIYRKTHQLIAEMDCRAKKVNYVSRAERSALLRACNSERDRLIIRMGFEVGLRAGENKGLMLNDSKAKGSKQMGLLRLFDELDIHPEKQSFEYVLIGKYTKGGKTRNIYFDRTLLVAMKHYYDNERLVVVQRSGCTSNTFFVRNDNAGAGLPIRSWQASILFSKLRNKHSQMNSMLCYHDLRHTFATELYHSELLDPEGQETRSESAALIVVAERLGHKNPSTSVRYIRLRHQMLIIEDAI